ncbi:MAG TPA: branched-chain amino acid ABC transporter permease [Chthoniobacterales bacterium]|nr:branched-chain amino acid ABC transporter permease [Chthoniobacterales bacterium]
MFWQQSVNGLSVGLVYGLLAIGLVMIFSTTRIVNFAHGEIFSLGAFIGLALQGSLHLSFGLAGVTAVGVVFIAFSIFGYVVNTKLRDSLTRSVATIAVGFGLRDLMLVVFGSDSSAYPTVYPEGGFDLGGVRLPYSAVIISGSTVVVLFGVAAFLWETRWGIFMRAVAQNADLARATGIRAERFQAVAFGAGAALAALAGVLVSPQWHVSYTGGSSIALKAFTAALIGGFNSSTGTLLGGLLVGLLETFIAGYVSSTWKDLNVYVCLLLILVFRPKGLLGVAKRRIG